MTLMADRRASDREREAAVARLKPRLVDGSLSTDTFGIRVESAYSARTKRELAELLDDIPGVRARAGAVYRRAIDWVTGAPSPRWAELRLPEAVRQTEFTIGRGDECDLVVEEATVSRRHALLRRTPEGWDLCDVGSTNGTRVNGWRIERAGVRPGDELELGFARFVVRA